MLENGARIWLVEKRAEKNLTQSQLAEKVGVTQQVMSKYETGERTPSVKTAKKIGKILRFGWTKFFN